MDKKRLLEDEIRSFIKEHEGDDLRQLMLQKDKYAHLPLRDIIEEIIARRKAEKKIPAWYKTAGILYPPGVSIEQSSSEITAQYKASLFSGNSALDLTGGFGVDSYYLAKKFDKFCYVEKNKGLAQIAQHNFTCLRQHNIEVNALSAEGFLSRNKQKYDLVYIDPDRRPGEKRVTGFKESKPEILSLLPELQQLSANILVKASPMMDISLGINELRHVKMVIVLAVDNEVKELLFWLGRQKTEVKIRCVNLGREGEDVLDYIATKEELGFCNYAQLSKYLYEPNASIMKAGIHTLLCKKFGINKLHPNTHLYTTEKLLKDFPGRKFHVIGEESYNKRKVSVLLNSSKANTSVRNFPDTPEQVKKKLGLKDGGQQYVFGFRNLNNDLRIAICEKL